MFCLQLISCAVSGDVIYWDYTDGQIIKVSTDQSTIYVAVKIKLFWQGQLICWCSTFQWLQNFSYQFFYITFFCIYHLILKLRETNHKPFNSQDLFNNAPYSLPYSFCDVRLENLVLDQLIIPLLIFFYILITCLLDIELILEGEILSWSLMGVKGLN